ncbi:HAMP domain-containing histidine kinase [Pseudonocardia bannensis]|uniref:histidine kinase n=1 Tax=Pseudonocardia bannensis TaxID=630973 RepID=A0A848DQ31_9PSEU|nr:HAMP domain-containing histidine kinase [Pseudonocardia bannensis]
MEVVTVALSLRWRVAVAFGLASLVVTGLLGFATWNLASSYMLAQREQSATRQAAVNVRLVGESLRSGSDGLAELLTGLAGDPESTIALSRSDGWITVGRQVDPATLPHELIMLAEDGVPARQRIITDGVPVLAVALPVATTATTATYVELFPLLELDRTFRFLSAVLITGAAISALLGLGMGYWAARRALRPLVELTDAAGRVARGDLQARLPEQPDPDLAPLAATFNRTASALEQRVRRDARFASDVSHELRSPLTTMVNAVEVLHRRRTDMPTAARQAVDLLSADVGRFQRMVVDLLEISRTDQDVDDRALEAVDVADLVRNIAASRPEHPPTEVHAQPALVLADRRRLDRVVTNLLDNGERHGGGVLRLAVLRRSGRVRLEIDDAGPGVPPELREQVFERFARGQRAGDRGDSTGSGLGLALVAQHIDRHGGAVWVEERPGGGARFVVELPELQESPEEGLTGQLSSR